MNINTEEIKPIIHARPFSMRYTHHAGPVRSRFLLSLRDEQRITGTKCPGCGRVYVPDRSTCLKCFEQMDERVAVSDEGSLLTYAVINAPEPGWPLEPPFCYGIIRLDGADTGMVHVLGAVDPEKIRTDMRVKAVFNEKRKGSIWDIEYFRPI